MSGTVGQTRSDVLRQAIALAFGLLFAPMAVAQDSGLRSLASGDEARGWSAVGRLELGGRGFCTGTLVADDLVLTAAHCLIDPHSGLTTDPALIEFRAGWRLGRAEAYRTARVAVAHPEWRRDDTASPADRVVHDLALVRLDRPIRLPGVAPMTLATPAPGQATVSVVSYAEDRAELPSLQDRCTQIRQTGRMLVLSCDVTFGSSGAPVFAPGAGGPAIVGVVSGIAESGGAPVSLAAPLGPALAEVMAALDAAEHALPQAAPATRSGGGALNPGGARNGTGARFIRP